MGQSTNAILCFGFEIGEEDDPPEILLDADGEIDFEDCGMKHFGGHITAPEPFDIKCYENDSDFQKLYTEYWKSKQELIDGIGVDLVRHCSTDYPRYILAVKKSIRIAHRGEVVVLDNRDIAIKREWQSVLEDFCTVTGIPFGEPQFILCSYWG